MMNKSYQRFVLFNLGGLALSAMLFTWIARDGTMDFWLAQQFFDPASGSFSWRDVPLLSFYGHTVIKTITTLVWVICILLALISSWVAILKPWRRTLFTFVILAGCAAYAVQMLKGASIHSCPWDLVDFGGSAQWFALFGPASDLPGPGHCWPGGHASGGFAFLAAYFALRELRPGTALWTLIISLSLGAVMSAVQIARGAHFLSHNLWSLWIVWAVCFVLDLLAHLILPQKGMKKADTDH